LLATITVVFAACSSGGGRGGGWVVGDFGSSSTADAGDGGCIMQNLGGCGQTYNGGVNLIGCDPKGCCECETSNMRVGTCRAPATIVDSCGMGNCCGFKGTVGAAPAEFDQDFLE
jgi:hypothetical protein